MPVFTTPLDGRLTSQNVFTGPFDGTELFWTVAPGNAQQGNTYAVSAETMAAYFGALAAGNTQLIDTGAVLSNPYYVTTADIAVLFNKTVSSDSYTVLPTAVSRISLGGILFKDVKGDADSFPITINFSGGEECDGLNQLTISNSYGWLKVFPVPGGGAWYLGS